MRKLKNKSITIIISMLLLFVGAFTWLTFSLSRADEHENEDQPPAAGATTKTNIDLIIQNSNDEEKEEDYRKYHIVEISSGNPGSFKDFCSKVNADGETDFELLVLNEHRTKQMQNEAGQIVNTAVFKPGYIDYKPFSLKDLRTGATTSEQLAANFKPLLEAVVSADLIYVSCDVSNDGANVFSASSDFTKDLENLLTLYVTNDLKPIIIDSPTKVADDLYGSSKTFQYIGAAFGESGSARNTFAWQFDNTTGKLDPADAMSYFTRSMPSKYLPISGRDVEADKWTEVSYDGKNYKAAKILTVKANGGANPITDQVKEGLGSEVTVDVVGTSNTLKAQRIYAGIDVEEEELINEDPDDTYDIFNPIASESGNKASLTITAAFTGNDDAAYNPTASAKLHILDYKRDEYKSDIDVSDGTKLSYNAGSHAYVIDFTKDNSSITLENIPVECIYYIETTNDDITDSDTYDAEANKVYLPYRVLETGSNAVDLEYTYKADCGSIEYGVFYNDNVIEPGPRHFYFALFNDSNGELRTDGFDVRDVRLGNGASDFVNLEWDGVPYGSYFVLETDSTGKVLDGGRLATVAGMAVDADHRIVVASRHINGISYASDVKINYTIADLGIPDDQVPDFQFAIRLRDEKGKLVTGTFPAVLNDGSTDTDVSVEFKNGMAVSTIGGAEVEAVEIPYKGSLTITIPDQYRYRISEISPLKVFSGTDLHYRYNTGNFNDYILADGNADYTFENDYVESYGSALFYAYKIYEQHPDFIVNDVLQYNAADDTKNFSNINLEDYDLIIFEGNLQSVLLATGKNGQPDDYNKLKTYMKSKTVNGYYNHIIYASNICPENSNQQGYYFDGADIFMSFYNSLMIKPDVPNGAYSVLLTSPSEMTANLVTNKSANSVDDIAELINKGRYRFSGGKADVTNKYTVLELQPCYPIDLGLAKILSKNKDTEDATAVANKYTNNGGYYYLDYDNVLNGYTKDEIQIGAGALADVENVSYDTITETYYVGTGVFETVYVEEPTGEYTYTPGDSSDYNGTNYMNGDVLRMSPLGISTVTSPHTVIKKYDDGSEDWKITADYQYIANRCLMVKKPVTKTVEKQQEKMEKKTRDIQVRKSSYATSVADNVTVDYYDWEVSPAKVLHMLQQTKSFTEYSIDDIVVEHMSTEEFVCSKKSLLDNYDMIYIGGNNTAIKDLEYFVANPSSSKTLGINDATYYNMYYHNGDIFRGSSYVKGFTGNDYGVQLGNDLTLTKYDELVEYVNNDMPVIISNKLANAYDGSGGSYKGHDIDPDSRMYAFLGLAKTKGNVAWGVDTTDTVRVDVADLNGVNYVPDGHTLYSGYVTLFKQASETTIVNLLNNHGSRPKFMVTYAPTQYNLYKSDTVLASRDLNFEFEIQNMQTGHTYTARLYLDDNGDSRFDRDKEEVDNKPGALGKAEHTVPDDFFGSVYMKLTITDKYTGVDGVEYEQRSSTEPMLFKIDPPDTGKDKINILQILPEGGTFLNGLKSKKNQPYLNTLYFCTECQLCGGVVEGGTKINGSGIDNASVFKRDGSGKIEPALNAGDIPNFCTTAGDVSPIKNRIEAYEHANGDAGYTLYVNGLGAHKHIFGIPKYKAITEAPEWAAVSGFGTTYDGLDDYNDNLADYIADDYEFNMEIVDTKEFDDLCDDILAEYAGKSAAERDSIRTEHSDKRSEFELYYDILNMLMTTELKDDHGTTYTYHPYTLAYINEVFDGITVTGGTPNTDINTLRRLRGLLKTLYSINSINWTSNDATFDAMNLTAAYNHVDGLINTANTRLGFTASNADAENFFQFIMDKYGYSKAEMADFESIMHELGASDADIISFAGCGPALDTYINGTIIPALDTKIANNQTAFSGKPAALVKSYFKQIVAHQAYSDYFSIDNASNDDHWDGTKITYNALFRPWRNAGIYRKYLNYKFMSEAKYASINDDGKIDFTNLYSIIIVGPADDFGGKDLDTESTDTLQTYIDNDGHVLLFYDTINVNVKGKRPNEVTAPDGPMSENLTATMRDTFGQDARPESELKMSGFSPTADEYYISALGQTGTPSTSKAFSSNAITNRSILFGSDKGQMNDAGLVHSLMYKYGSYVFFSEGDNNRFETYHFIKSETWKRSVTDRASRNNKGIVTMYPFPLGPVLNITATNPQGFNVDIEDDDMTVYYSLAGGTGDTKANGKSTSSSLFAATPNDGADNYFIYQYKNVTYCGAGNTSVTGLGTDNNDERMLFINIIVNTLRKSAIGTQVRLYDALKTDPNTGKVTNPMANAKLKPTGTGLYEIEAKSMTDSPEFSFYIKTDKNVSITRVTAYYDLDLADSSGDIIALSKSHPYDTDTFNDAATNIKHQDASGNALREHVLIYDTGSNMANLRDADKDLNKKQRNVNLGIVKDITKNSDGTYSSYNAGLQGVTYGESSNGSYYAAGCNLELREDYFKPYDGAYTFITVRVETKDAKGRDLAPVYRRIKVVLPYELFDLN